MNSTTVHYQWCRLAELSALEFHALIQLREFVFVVEQLCVCQEADDYDLKAWHLIARQGTQIVAYCRVKDPSTRYAEPSIGRVLTAPSHRGLGLGQQLMAECMRRCAAQHPHTALRISAQSYLLRFYESFGFVVCSEQYLEDNIPHHEMLRAA